MIQNNVSMPSFKGLIYFKNQKVAVNTDEIREISDYCGSSEIKYKNIYIATGSAIGTTLKVDAPVGIVIDAYKKACCCKDTVVTI